MKLSVVSAFIVASLAIQGCGRGDQSDLEQNTSIPSDGTVQDDRLTGAEGSGLGLASTAKKPGSGRGEVYLGPENRPALFKPALTSKIKVKRPLLLVLHAHGFDGAAADWYLNATNTAKLLNAHLLLPNGRPNLLGQRFWEATDACCNFLQEPLTGPSDVDYLVGLVKEASAKYSVDAQQVYVVGYASGSFMANRLACDHAEVFAGVVSVSGGNWNDTEMCKPSKPINFLHVHGNADSMVLFDGGLLYGVPYPSANETTSFWAAHNKCKRQSYQAGADELSFFNIDMAISGIPSSPDQLLPYYSPDMETDRQTYSGCQANGRVGLWVMNGLGHAPFYNPDFLLKALSFVKKH